VALGFAIFFLLLRSQVYTAVDGAVRCFAVFHNPATPLHGNSHMLYPFWMRLWTGAAAAVGFDTHNWQSFIRMCQALNGFAAAASIGMLFYILEVLAGVRLALLGSLQFGLSTAVMLHATNSAEPVMGLFFSIAALWVLLLGLRTGSNLAAFFVGILLTFAMASYESMALTAVPVALGCVCWPGTSWRLALKRLAVITTGGVVSLVTVYSLSYSSLGIPPRRMFAQLFVIADNEYYGGFSLSKLLNTPVGLVRDLFAGVPDNYSGLRHMARGPHGLFWVSIDAVSLALLAVLGWFVVRGLAAAVRRSPVWKPLLWAGVALTGFAAYFPVLYRGPLYDKMWLLPLAVTLIAVAVAFHFGGPRVQRLLTIGLAALVIVEAARNIPRAVADHVHETPHLNDARNIASLVTPRDAVVYDFDDVSQMYVTIWGYGINTLSLPASTRQEAEEWLAEAARKETAGNGNIYFISVLDQDREHWNAFLGNVMSIPYGDFDCYREKSVVVQRYSLGGESHTVRRLESPSACPSAIVASQKPN